MKKIKSLLLVLMLFLSIASLFNPITMLAEEDEEESEQVEERSDYEKCIYDKDRKACERLTKDSKNNLEEIEERIKEAESDREKAKELAAEYASKAESMQDEIDDLSKQIDELQKKITDLEARITENEAKVEALNSRVKGRMVESQKTMHFNGYLDFILGSNSFLDMLRRIYGIQAIMSKDEKDRTELLEIIAQLNADRAELETAKQQLDESFEEIVAKQAELIAIQEFYEEEEARINEELDAMTEERDNIYESFEDLKQALKEASMIVNDGFVAPVHNSSIVATVWNYSPDFLNGKWHLGVDYAAARGTELHAPAGGVILRADASCGDPGYLGNACGAWISGGGNQIYLMAEVEGKVYGFIFFHMNTIYVERGDYVSQDEVLGLVGSSGSSTGPHCHIEMYYLGDGDIFDFLDKSWNATFSVGRGATAYNNRCYYDDGTYRQGAPCILNPEWYLPNR